MKDADDQNQVEKELHDFRDDHFDAFVEFRLVDRLGGELGEKLDKEQADDGHRDGEQDLAAVCAAQIN